MKQEGKTLGINDPVFKILAYQDICDDLVLEYRYHMVEKNKYPDIQTKITL